MIFVRRQARKRSEWKFDCCRKALAYMGLGYQARTHLPELWQQYIAYMLIILLFCYMVLRRSKMLSS